MRKLFLKDLKIESFITDRGNIKGGVYLATHSSDTGAEDCATPHGTCPSRDGKGC
ncbi:MAG: pinensin family lanthipeptide [Cyclobacteriaceae bacterium]